MANLLSIAEQAYNQLFPRPTDEEAVDKQDFVATAKNVFAYELWRKIKEDKLLYGECDIPSYLLSEAKLDVKDDEMDISSLKIMRSIDQELWLQNIGGMNCECLYVKSTLNLSKILCDDDSLPDDSRTFYPQGLKIKFPNGVHATPLSIIYANQGEEVNERIEIDDAIAGIVRVRLIEIYGGKIGQEDKANDSNSNTK
jgi:hypothetical protein